MKKLLTLSIIMLSISTAYAQEWESGEIKEIEIEIRKDRQIVLPKANRLFEKIPPRSVEQAKADVTYNFKAFNFSTPELSPVIRPLRLKVEDPSPIYRGYVSAGYGNYSTPYLDAFVTSKPDKKKLIGAHAFFNKSGKGPVDGKNSAGGTTGVSAFAQTFSKELSFNGNIGYQNRSTHFYGYNEGPVLADTIEQTYSLFNMGLNLSNARNTDFAYQVGGDFSFLKDKFDAKESTVDLRFKGAYKISEANAINLKGDYSIISRSDVGIEAKPRNLFQANGNYSFTTQNNLYLQVGATVAFENDPIDSKDFHIYPDVKATYALNDQVDFVGSLSGGMEKVSLQTLANENIWLGPSVSIFHTNKLFDVQAGIRAKLGGKVLAGAGISFASLKNLYFFLNDPLDGSKFIVDYDDNTTRTNFYASLLFNYSDVVRFSLQGDYFAYDVEDIGAAWHKPTYRVTAGASYNLYKKLIFNLDMIAQGGMKANPTPLNMNGITLDAAFDLSFRTEYLVSDRFSAFVELNNIASNKYPLFFNYPARGFQALVGMTWKF